MAITVEMRTEVSELYVALFGRAPDGEGLGYWVGRLDGGESIVAIANSMYETAPARAYYPDFLTNQEIIASFYENVLGRTADAEGLAFWTAKLNAAGATPGSVIAEMIDVVTSYDGTDPAGLMSAALFANKVEVAQWYGETNGSIEGASEVLTGVTEDPASVDAVINGYVTTGETFTLTDSVDNVNITTVNTVDTVTGVVDGANGTFTVGDNIDGNGHTILQLAVVGATVPYATVQDVATVKLINAANVAANFEASSWSNIGEIVMESGVGGGSSHFNNLESGVDLAISVNGTLSANYTDGSYASLEADAGDSITLADGDLTVAAANGNSDYVQITSTSDLTLGSVMVTAADSASVSVDLTSSADLTIGDITLTGGDSATVTLDAYASADLTVGNVTVVLGDSASMDGLELDAANNITIGDITLTQGDNGNSNDISISSSTSGDVTVGNVSLTIGDDGNSFTFDVYANSGDITVGDITGTIGDSASGLAVTVEAYYGDVTVGDVTLTAGAGTSNGVSLDISDWNTTGNVTVGDVSVSVGQSASLDVEISATGTAGTTADGAPSSLGSMAIGDLTFNLAEDATGSVDIEHYTTGTLTGTAAETIGELTIGDIAVNLGADATINISITQAMYGTQTSGTTVGDVTIGDFNAELGIGASASISIEVSNTAAGNVGNVAVGDINVVGDDGAWFQYTLDVSAQNDIESVTVGDINVDLGVDAGGYVSLTVDASGDIGTVSIGDVDWAVGISSTDNEGWWMGIYADGDIDSVTRGDTNVVLAADASNTYAALSVTASGDIGSVTKGDITYALGADAYASYDYLGVYADGNVGTVTQGDLDVTVGADATFTQSNYVSVTASGTVDTVTVGDIVADVAAGGDFDYNVFVSGDDGVGSVSVGDIVLSSDGGDLANVTVEVVAATGDIGSVSIGDIDLTAAGGASVSFTLEINGSGALGALTLGNIDLDADDTSVVAVNLLTNTLNVMGTEADITIDSLALHATGGASIDFNVGYATYAGDITINNIAVDVSADATGNYALTNILTDVSTSGTLTLGTVDYSDFAVTSGASIDVSGYAGDIVVIGSAFADTITDNTEANTLTGGDGADTFSFVTMNANGTGLTAAAADVITDFEHGTDTIELDVSNAASFSADTYYEGSAASFADFLTLATTQMTSSPEDNLVAVQVGSDVWLAVDMDDGDAVDTVIQLTGVSLSSLNFADFAFV